MSLGLVEMHGQVEECEVARVERGRSCVMEGCGRNEGLVWLGARISFLCFGPKMQVQQQQSHCLCLHVQIFPYHYLVNSTA